MAEMSRPCSAAIFRTSGVERRRRRSSRRLRPFDGRGAGAGAEGAGRAPAAAALPRCGDLVGRRSGCGSRGPGRGRRAATRASLRLDPRHDGLHRDRLAFLHQDLGERAGDRRRDLGIHLVGGDLEDRFVALDRVADLLHPARDGALGDGLAHLGHDDVDTGHVLSSSLVRRYPPRRAHDVTRLRQHEVFQRRRVGQRHVVRRHAPHRRVQPLEAELVDPRRDLAGDAAGDACPRARRARGSSS